MCVQLHVRWIEMEGQNQGIMLCYICSGKLQRVRAGGFTFLNVVAPYAFASLGKQDQVPMWWGMEQNIRLLLLIYVYLSPLTVHLGNISDECLMDYGNTFMKLCLVFLFLVPGLVYSGVCQSSINLQLKIRRSNSLPHGKHHVVPQFTVCQLVTTPTVYLIYDENAKA